MRAAWALAALLFVAISAAQMGLAETLIPPTCANFPGDQVACEAVRNEIDLSLNDKKDLFAELWIENGLLPNHDAIYDWDNDLAVGSPPQTTSLHDTGIIRNAWIRFLYILPAVYDKQEALWYFPTQVSTKVKYDYYIALPSGIEGSDCQTTYSVANNDATVTIKRNGSTVASGITSSFSTVPGGNTLTAQLDVDVTMGVTHYSLVTNCIAHDPITGACTQTATSCQSTGSEFRSYSHTGTESILGIRQDFSPDVEFTYEDLNGLREAKLQVFTVGVPNEIILDFGDTNYTLSESSYGVKRRLAPYDYLYLERNKKQGKTKNGLVELGFERAVNGNQYAYEVRLGLDQKPTQCSLKVLGDFEEVDETAKCVFHALTPTLLVLHLDKDDYDFKEDLTAQAQLTTTAGQPLSGKTLTLRYGEKAIPLTTDADGNVTYLIPAKQSLGLVQASFASDGTYTSARDVKRVTVRSKVDWELVTAIIGYIVINVIVLLLLQKYLGQWLTDSG